MDTLRLVGGAVVAYLSFVFVLGPAHVVPDAVGAFVSFAAANATQPVVILNATLAAAVCFIVALVQRNSDPTIR